MLERKLGSTLQIQPSSHVVRHLNSVIEMLNEIL